MFQKLPRLVFGMMAILASAFAHSAVILQYHHVSDTLPAVTSVDAPTFKAHMQHIKKHGYKVIPLDEMISQLQQGEPLPANTLAITFDDGYDNNIEEAAPILAQFNYPYTIFVNSKLIDEGKSYVMTWEQLRTLSKQGALIANHSSQHDYLHRRLEGETKAQWQQRITDDLNYAQRRIEEEIGPTPKYLAYPYGEFNNALQALIKELGYVGIGQHSGAVGVNSDFTRLPRFPSSGFYADLETLGTKMASYPFAIAALDYDDSVTSNTRPPLTLTFAERDFNQKQFACYVSGQGQAQLTWQGNNTVTIKAKQELGKGRSRYNCTAPVRGEPGHYYWFSQPWVVTSAPE